MGYLSQMVRAFQYGRESRPVEGLRYRGRRCYFCRNKFGKYGVSKYLRTTYGDREVCGTCFKAMS